MEQYEMLSPDAKFFNLKLSRKSIDKLVRAGKYNWVNQNINSKNFSVKKGFPQKIIIQLVSLTDKDSQEIIKMFNKKGWRPMNLFELLSFGIQFPEIQRENRIVALGTIWIDPLCGLWFTPVLHGNSRDRSLGLFCFETRWRKERFWFGAVKM
jgi:hypothetical protein